MGIELGRTGINENGKSRWLDVVGDCKGGGYPEGACEDGDNKEEIYGEDDEEW
jgi:hypothetical protein